jgi:uncharacterized membrane-anchored protein
MAAPLAALRRTGIGGWLDDHAPVAAKVPEITAIFWVVKVLTTAMGEVTSDYFGQVNIAIGGLVEVGLFATALWLQFRSRRYQAVNYWFLAIAIAIFGTGVSDALHLFLPYAGTTALWAVVLGAIFATWYRSEGTLSIHSVFTTRREIYYWATVFATFALGTAMGDLTAASLNMGFLASAIFFGVVILIPLVLWGMGMSAVATFWFAYVDTRPLGASVVDYLSKPHTLSGVALGNGPVTAVAVVAVVALVGYLHVSRRDVQAGTA